MDRYLNSKHFSSYASLSPMGTWYIPFSTVPDVQSNTTKYVACDGVHQRAVTHTDANKNQVSCCNNMIHSYKPFFILGECCSPPMDSTIQLSWHHSGHCHCGPELLHLLDKYQITSSVCQCGRSVSKTCNRDQD